MTFSSAVDYRTAREALISEDRSLRRDRVHDSSKVSAEEIKADQIVRGIRAAESSTIWRQDHESIMHPFPGMEFLTGMCDDFAWRRAVSVVLCL